MDREDYLISNDPLALEGIGMWPIRFIRVVGALGGVCLIVWALAGDAFRDSEGALKALFCLPLSIGIGTFTIAAAIGTSWLRTAMWFWLALAGQAAALQVIDAGWQLHYQHYYSFSRIITVAQTPVIAVLTLQILAVGVGLWMNAKTILNWTRTNVRFWHFVLMAIVFYGTAATVSEDIAFYLNELIVAGAMQTLSLLTLVLLALSIPPRSIDRIRDLITNRLTQESKNRFFDKYALLSAAFVIVLSACLNIYSYEKHPHVPDEVAYLMHAELFASGSIALPAPPVPEAFEVYLLKVDGDRWYPVPPPGWPLILAAGALFGLPWLVNPLFAGLNIMLAYLLLREISTLLMARTSVFLLAFSPWYLFMGMSFMTHMAALTCCLLAALGVAWSRRTGRWVWAFFGGLAIGFLAAIRPLEAVAVAGLLGFWAIGAGGRRLRFLSVAALVLGSIVTGFLGLGYNAVITGDPLRFPINAYTEEVFGPNSNAYGFGPDRGMGWALDPFPGHGPLDAIVNSNLNITAINSELFGWSIGAFLFIAGLFVFGRLRTIDYLSLAVIAVIYLLHFFYYYSGGPDFGARYWFLMILPLVVLTVRGMAAISAKLRESSTMGDVRLYAVVACLSLMAMLNFVPWRAADKYHNFRGMRPDVRYLDRAKDFGRSLVLVQGNQHPDYDSAFIYNPLDLEADAPIYAWDRDPATRAKLLSHYSDRPVWIVKGPSLTGRGFEVVAGPLMANGIPEANAD